MLCRVGLHSLNPAEASGVCACSIGHRMIETKKLANLVEGLNTSLSLGKGDERIENPSWVVLLRSGGDHPEQTTVRPLHFQEDIPASVLSIRDTLHRRGPRCATWEIGPSARPAHSSSG